MLETPKDCPIPNTHDKYNEAQYFFERMLKAYHDPWEFQFNLNAFIQALRNVTFMLQAEDGKPEAFGPWYEAKQAEMRENALLRRFVGARNIVVKRSSLASRSKVRTGLFRGRRLKLAFAYDIPPFTDTRQELKKAVDSRPPFLDEEHSAIGEQMGVERTWIVDELGESEACSLCLEAFELYGATLG